MCGVRNIKGNIRNQKLKSLDPQSVLGILTETDIFNPILRKNILQKKREEKFILMRLRSALILPSLFLVRTKRILS
jgi:hypothetical protein